MRIGKLFIDRPLPIRRRKRQDQKRIEVGAILVAAHGEEDGTAGEYGLVHRLGSLDRLLDVEAVVDRVLLSWCQLAGEIGGYTCRKLV